jgi:hypothetical protein
MAPILSRTSAHAREVVEDCRALAHLRNNMWQMRNKRLKTVAQDW